MSESADDEGSTETAVAGGKDRISTLPDGVLRHLLSFLPSQKAVQTCVLAKPWRTLWKSVPTLRIKDEPKCWLASEYFIDEPEYNGRMQESRTFVNELLRLRDPTHLNICQISSSYWDPYWFDEGDDEDAYHYEEAFQRIEPWLRYALSHQVQVLRVEAAALATNLALVSSHLKRVELISMHFDGSLDFSSCPVLDVLEMSRCTISVNIVLRHLSIRYGSFGDDIRSHISAPNLISLKLAPYHRLPLLIDTMPSLETASIIDQPASYEQYRQDSFSVVLEAMSCATNLELIATKYKHSPILETLTLQLNFRTDWEYYLFRTYESCNSREQGYNSMEQSLLSKHLKVVKIIRGKKDDVIIQRISKILGAHGIPSEQIDIRCDFERKVFI